jgi:hypothetical protein
MYVYKDNTICKTLNDWWTKLYNIDIIKNLIANIKYILNDSTSLHHYLKFIIKIAAIISIFVLYIFYYFNNNNNNNSFFHILTAIYVSIFVAYFILELTPLIQHLNAILLKNNNFPNLIYNFIILFFLFILIFFVQNISAPLYFLLSIIVLFLLFKFNKILSIVLLIYSSFLAFAILFFIFLKNISRLENIIYYTLIVLIFFFKIILLPKESFEIILQKFLFFSFFIAFTILLGIIFHNNFKHLFFDINDKNKFNNFFTSSEPILVISNKIKNSEVFDSWFFLNKEKNQAVYIKIIIIILLLLLVLFSDEIINRYSVFIFFLFKKILSRIFSKNKELQLIIINMYCSRYDYKEKFKR